MWATMRLLTLFLSASAPFAFHGAGGAPRRARATVVRAGAVEDLRAMKAATLRQALGKRELSWASYIEREVVRRCRRCRPRPTHIDVH
jgi:thioredoxin